MRNQFGGHAVQGRAPARWRRRHRVDSPCTSRTWSCTTSAPTPTSRSSSSPAPTAFIGSNGQGKTNLVEAIDYLSRLSSHRVATDAPLVRAGADQAVSAPRWCATAVPPCSRWRSTRAGPTGRGSTSRRCPRPATWSGWCAPSSSPPRTSPWSRATRPSGAASSTTCWCCAPRGWPACAPTTSGSCASATRCSRPPATRAAARRRRTAPCPRWACGTPTSPGSAPRSWPSACVWSPTCGPTSATPTPPSPGGPRATPPRPSTSRRSTLPDGQPRTAAR